MSLPRAYPLLVLFPLACTANVDLGDLTASSTSTTGTSAPATTDEEPTTTPTSDETGAETTSPEPSTSTGAGPQTDTGTGEDTGTTADTGSDTGAPPLDCSRPQDFLRTPELWLPNHSAFAFAFDGQGHVATSSGLGLVIVDADTNEYVLIDSDTWYGAYGMAYLADGRLLASQNADVIAIDPQGFFKKFIVGSGFVAPWELRVDLGGNVWLRDDDKRLIRVAPDLTQKTVYEGGPGDLRPGNFLYDDARKLLFFSVSFQQDGHLMRMPIADDGTPGEATILRNGVGPMALDACGNLYYLLQYNNLGRLLLDADGLNFTDQYVANGVTTGDYATMHFGVGPGFDPYKLYVHGTSGGVWTVEMEFPGAPVTVVE